MKIILSPGPNVPLSLTVSEKVKTILENAGHTTVYCSLFADMQQPGWKPIESEKHDADYLIVFGGDGTLLRASRLVADVGLPIAAINLGHLGFIAEIGQDDIDSFQKLAKGNFSVDNRMMLDVKLIREGECILEDFALNDIEIKGHSRVISLEISGDDAVMLNFTGDGAVIASPTGSTAYSMSAGGPIIEPDSDNIVVTPICPHMLAVRSFVLSPHRKVKVRVTPERNNPGRLSIDGNNNTELMVEDIIEISMSEKRTRLIHVSNRSFYSTVYEKLGNR